MPHNGPADLHDRALTFLFTDVEGSTKLWEREPEAMRVALETHDRILRQTISATGGTVFSTAGDAFAAAFDSPERAVDAAAETQQALAGHAWPDGAPIRVRMGVHTGAAHQRDDNFYGPTLNRAARLMSAADGGQTVLSSATRPFVDDVTLRDLGEHRLKDLSEPEHVWQLIVDGLTTEFPPLRTLDAAPTNLPLTASSFIGRAADIEAAMATLEDNRLVTMTGVGGVGKTRLALQVAADASHHYPDGLWFLELAPVRIGDAVPYRFLEALGLDAEPGRSPLRTVAEAIGDGAVLLVVDNCEHLLTPVADAVAELLASCPDLRVLATSRRSLGISGERVVPVRPLGASGADSASTELFLERAEAAGGADFADRLEIVAHICRRLDGVPLAIELAAARTRSMTPEDLADRLDGRFRLLKASRSHERDDRHRTLEGTIEWSHDLLDDEQQLLFARLAVFAGAFTVEAAENVCADDALDRFEVMDLIDDLVDHSLLTSDTSGHRTRFRMLETIREFAVRRLGDELTALRDRHAAWHVTWAERIGGRTLTADELGAVEDLEAGWSDLRAAATHATGDLDLLARLLSPLAWEAQSRARLEFGDWVDHGLASTDAETGPFEARAALLACGAAVRSVGGDHGGAIAAATELAALAEERGIAIPVVLWAAAISGVAMTGDIALAARLQDRFERAAEDDDGPWVASMVAALRSVVDTYLGRPETAREAAAAAVALAPPDFSPTLRAVIHWMVARNSEAAPAEVVPVVQDGLDLATGVRSTIMAATLTLLLSFVRAQAGDRRGPLLETVDSLQSALDNRAMGQVAHLISGAALIMVEAGLETEPVTLLGWLQTHEAFRSQLPELAEEDRERAVPFLEAGAAMSTEEIVGFAIDTLRAAAAEMG